MANGKRSNYLIERLDSRRLLYYINRMAKVLDFDRQVIVIGSLAEWASIRSIERMTGVHRDTIMRLGVKVGQGCAKIQDAIMRDLPCAHLQMDEIWGYIESARQAVRAAIVQEFRSLEPA